MATSVIEVLEQIRRAPPAGAPPASRPATAPADDRPLAPRDLRGLRPLVLFLDGVGGVLLAWALTWEGRRVLLSAAHGEKADAGACRGFVGELARRGLREPLVVVTDGASELEAACGSSFPSAIRQHCLDHQLRHLAARLPGGAPAALLQAMRVAYDAPTPSLARALKRRTAARHAARLPALVADFERTFGPCTARLELPPSLQRVARATLAAEWLDAARRRAGADAALETLRDALARTLASGREVAISEADARRLESLGSSRSQAELLASRSNRRCG